MIDITSVTADGELRMSNTQVPRASNLLSVQLGNLEYAQDFGIDLLYFLNPDFKFQNESFKAYLIERLANSGINVSSISETVERLFREYKFEIASDDNGGGLVAG